MRRFTLLCCAVLAAGCAKPESNNDVAADTVATLPAPPTPGEMSLNDVAGTWAMRVMAENKDTVLTTYRLWISQDTTNWQVKFDSRPDTIQVHMVAMAGDSLVASMGPYRSALRQDVMVTTQSVYRIQNGKLVGVSVAHYDVPTTDSVMRFRTIGDRQ